MKVELLVMRLADMERVHPDQITLNCSVCNHEVGVYPSGQRVLAQKHDVRIICQICKQPGSNAMLAPGAKFEPFQSVRRKQ
jgi:transcription elongation factor Elf1